MEVSARDRVNGVVLQPGGNFFCLWESMNTTDVVNMNALRVGVIDESGLEKIIAYGRSKEILYIIRRTPSGYEVEMHRLSSGGGGTLDIWPLAEVEGLGMGMIMVLLVSLGCLVGKKGQLLSRQRVKI